MNTETHDIVVIGSSAGGISALKQLVHSFNKDIKASIFIVQHVAADAVSHLPQILSHVGPLQAIHPKDGEKIKPGMIYVAPPDHHMIIQHEYILVKRGPKENRFRPSVDTLMRSAAYCYGPRVIGAVLTGYLNDGTSGLWSVKEFGGITIVQSPLDALYADMPQNVLEHVNVTYNLPLAEIGPLINTLTTQPVSDIAEKDNSLKERIKAEIDIAAQQNALDKGIIDMGDKTNMTCPECGGTLVSIQEGPTIRYRCHTGHGFSSASLWSGITESVETKLWQALRSMEEGILFLEQSATRSEMAGKLTEANGFFQKADMLKERSKVLLDFIYTQGQINEVHQNGV